MQLSTAQRAELEQFVDLLSADSGAADVSMSAAQLRTSLDLAHPRLLSIWSKRAHRGPMDPLTEVRLIPGKGLKPGVDRSRRRQVTIIERENWLRFEHELGYPLDPSRRRANLMVTGIELARTRGRVLRVGDVRLAIGGEVTPCERMEEAYPGLQALMRPDWRGGAFAQVLDDGVIRLGDSVSWDQAPETNKAEKAGTHR